MVESQPALGLLAAMMTPAVLILASGSLILNTSQRLGRVLERTRRISTLYRELMSVPEKDQLKTEEAALFRRLFERASERSMLIQSAMRSLYLSLAAFVATSLVIGLAELAGIPSYWIVSAAMIVGVGLLLHASVLLVTESRKACRSVAEEMEFVKSVAQHAAARG